MIRSTRAAVEYGLRPAQAVSMLKAAGYYAWERHRCGELEIAHDGDSKIELFVDQHGLIPLKKLHQLTYSNRA